MPSIVSTENSDDKTVHTNGNTFEKLSNGKTTHNGTKVPPKGPIGKGKTPTSPPKSKFVPAVIGTTKALTSTNKPTSTINTLKPTVVGMWNLRNTSAKVPESFEALASTNGTVETVFDTDDRKRVRKEDFGPGGKYRSIVKLFLKFEGKGGPRTLIATGWLIAADLIVTAGHCAYDWEHSLGQVVEVKAYIGYNGRASVGSSGVQFRKGTRIATTSEWLKSGERHHDIAFITVLTPFTGVTPFKFVDTPRSGNDILGVVGYPGDLDKGEYMYECFTDVKYSIAKGKGMLQYKIDTYGGNSGSPVLRRKDRTSIGVHVMGGSINQASLIGPLGNVFLYYTEALRLSDKRLAKAPLEMSLIEFKQTESADDAFQADVNADSESYEDAEADEADIDPSSKAYKFMELFEKALALAKDSDGQLSTVGRPVGLGASGHYAAIFGHGIMQQLGKVARESGENSDEQEAGSEGEEIQLGALGRGVLCEAALGALLEMDDQILKKEGVFDKLAQYSAEASWLSKIKSVWGKTLHGPGTVGSAITTFAVGTAAGLVIQGISSTWKGKKESTDDDENEAEDHGDGNPGNEAVQNGNEADSNEDDDSKATDNKKTPTPKPGNKKALTVADLVESLLSHPDNDPSLKSLLENISAPLSEALPAISEAISADEAGSQEGVTEEESGSTSDALRSRIILGEAALQTLLEMSPETVHSESFFGKLWKKIKPVAGAVVSFAPSLILSAAGGAIMKKVGAKFGGKKEAGSDGEDGGEGGDDDDGPVEGADGDEADEGEDSGEAAALESFHEWYASKTGSSSDGQ